MPAIPIIDSHLHIWDPGVLRYPWLDDIALLNKSYLLDDYNHHTASTTVERMVFVQCECEPAQCELEAAWVTEAAKTDKRLQGIVPWAPLELGDVATDVLDRFAQNPLIKGIRRIIQFEADPDFCLRPRFIRGVQLLKGYDWTFDICVNHTQLPKVIEMVKQCPDNQFVLDHIGKPGISTHSFEDWNSNIKTLSQFENVDCKFSGLVTEANHEHWTIEDLKPYANAVLEHFGPNRLIFGGDWPVAFQASTYTRWIETTDQLLTSLSSAELELVYNKNAVRFYRLNE